jgi:site-specific recombinase XerD
MENISISIIIDKRRAKKDGTYPVKLRVFCPNPRTQKLYATNIDLTDSDFEKVWYSNRPRAEWKEIKRKLQKIEARATEIAENITPFNFTDFEFKFNGKSSNSTNIFHHFDQTVEKLRKNKQFGNASNYEVTAKSLKKYLKKNSNKSPDTLSFYSITPDWLQGYENYMIRELERSYTTVSIYLRTLRAVFNEAISDKIISRDYYPFGKKKFTIPKSKGVKKALTKEQLKILFNAKPANEYQEKARDFWFFSFVCNGMNVKDILMLRNKDFEADSFSFYRAKTITTRKGDLQRVTVLLTDFSKNVIKKYRSTLESPNAYVFPILDATDSELTNHRAVKNFTRFINQHIKKLAVDNGLPSDISSYWARHSFATKAIRDGASMEFVGEALNHQDTQTTKNYFAGFTTDVKREFAENILNFD